jgi:peroxiredoxin Q/BCP
MPNIGDKAPKFRLKNQHGESVALSDFKGQKVILYFYPKDDTPGCTKEAIGFSEALKAIKAQNAVVLGVSKDSEASHLAFAEKHKLKVTLLTDTDGKVCEAYGVWQEKTNFGKTYMGILRSTFLIAEDGIISKRWKGVQVDGHVEKVCDLL